MRDGVHGIPTGTLVQQWKAVIESMRGGSFYTRAEVDALLKSLKSVDPFPVGSIYQSTARTSPAALFGGTWQEIAQNRVLMGAGSGHAAGTTVEAGLPNITGSFVADVKRVNIRYPAHSLPAARSQLRANTITFLMYISSVWMRPSLMPSTAAAPPCSLPPTMCTSGGAWPEKGGFER